jgi:5S rRNA maturation endonuclease (ribonuclease M5)
MITSLSIQNFRGIEKTAIQDLGPINLFIGKNNSRKSSILESLYFAKAAFNPVGIFNDPVLRQLLMRRIRRDSLDPREFFGKYRTDQHIEFDFGFAGVHVLIEVSYSNDNRLVYSIRSPTDHGNLGSIRLGTQDTSPIIEQSIPLPGARTTNTLLSTKNWEQAGPSHPYGNYMASAKGSLDFLSDITLVDVEFPRQIDAIEQKFWGPVLENRLDTQLRKTLNEVYGTRIDQFTFAPFQGKYKLLTVLPEYSVYVDDYGDGFRYAFAILSVTSQLHNTALVLEEPEVHQHPGALKLLLSALCQLAQTNNVQLFISSHSPDLATIVSQFQGTKIFHCDMALSEQLTIRQIPAPDAKLLTDLGLDLTAIGTARAYLVVEGKEDRTFTEAVSRKLSGSELAALGIIVATSPKHEQKSVVAALASTGRDIMVLTDYDKDDGRTIFNSFGKTVKDKFGDLAVVEDSRILVSKGSTIRIFLAGLPTDEGLKAIGIDSFAMEDYLLKLIQYDQNVRSSMKTTLEELVSRAEIIRKETRIKQNKAILLTLATVQGSSQDEVIETVVRSASRDSVEKVIGTLNEIFKPSN